MKLQATTDPNGALLWIPGALPGGVHDTAAARIRQLGSRLREWGMTALADKGYCGLDAQVVGVPWKGRHKPEPKKAYNRLHARVRAPG